MGPVVTPVAANITSPRAISASSYFCFGVGHPHVAGAGHLGVVLEQQAALHLATEAAQRGGGQHAFRGAAGADEDVDAAVQLGRHDHAARRRHRRSA